MAETIHTKTESEQYLTDTLRSIAEVTRPPFFAELQLKAYRMATDALAYAETVADAGAGAKGDRYGNMAATVALLSQARDCAARAGLGAHFASELHRLAETARANMDAGAGAAGMEARA